MLPLFKGRGIAVWTVGATPPNIYWIMGGFNGPRPTPCSMSNLDARLGETKQMLTEHILNSYTKHNFKPYLVFVSEAHDVPPVMGGHVKTPGRVSSTRQDRSTKCPGVAD